MLQGEVKLSADLQTSKNMGTWKHEKMGTWEHGKMETWEQGKLKNTVFQVNDLRKGVIFDR